MTGTAASRKGVTRRQAERPPYHQKSQRVRQGCHCQTFPHAASVLATQRGKLYTCEGTVTQHKAPPPAMIPAQPRRSLWVGVGMEVLCIALMTRHGNFLQAGEPTRFTVLAFGAGAAFWLAARQLQRAVPSPRTRARWFWIVAILLRVAILPILPGDDVWRYRWEGSIQLHGFNPYLLAPDSPALAAWRDAGWSQINHQNFAAIYPPLTELTFAALARVGLPVPGYKLLFALADLAVAGVLRRLLARGGSSPDSAVWYAWNPLAVYVGAGGAHFDPLMVLSMMGAAWFLDRLPEPAPPASRVSGGWVPTQAWLSVLLLGAAIALKAVPAVLLPVWFFALGWRHARLALPVAAGVSPALALLYGFPAVPVFGGLAHFARDFRVNDAWWWLVDPADRLGGWSGRAAAVVCLALAVWFRRDWRRGMLWVLGAALLCSPSVHAWYAVWVLPVAVWRGARAWVVFSVSVFGYYLLWEVNHASGQPWVEPLWLRLLIYLPPSIAVVYTRFVRPSAQADPGEPCYQ